MLTALEGWGDGAPPARGSPLRSDMLEFHRHSDREGAEGAGGVSGVRGVRGVRGLRAVGCSPEAPLLRKAPTERGQASVRPEE